jgi:hypothetical protein
MPEHDDSYGDKLYEAYADTMANWPPDLEPVVKDDSDLRRIKRQARAKRISDLLVDYAIERDIELSDKLFIVSVFIRWILDASK